MLKSKFISINNIILIILALAFITKLVFAYLFLIKPIFLPSADNFLIKTKEVQIQKELFREVISELEKRPQRAKQALEKEHPDLFKP
ncbi:MAG: hypothetical protein ABIG90_03335 [bacterium]